MPRIRTIKPEMFQDEKLSPLAPIDRLVFIGLLSMADDAGRLLDNAKVIDAFIFPETEDSSRESLDVLARVSRISRYESPSGQRLIQITNWQRHQKVDKPSPYTLPGPGEPNGSGDSRESVASDSRSDHDHDHDQLPTITSNSVVPLPPRRDLTFGSVLKQIEQVNTELHDGTRSRLKLEQARALAAGVVFGYWQAKTDHPKALLDEKRERRIVVRLKENNDDAGELLYAIDGALRDKWHNGEKDGTKHLGIEHIFRTRERVEELAGLVKACRDGRPHPMAEKYHAIVTGEAT